MMLSAPLCEVVMTTSEKQLSKPRVPSALSLVQTRAADSSDEQR